MSKISQLHAELTEQASELGFESIYEAEQHGYEVDWENAKLIKAEDEQEQAHLAWLKERDRVLDNLAQIRNEMLRDDKTKWAMVVGDTTLFIKKGEM